jgi:hypothetical protein
MAKNEYIYIEKTVDGFKMTIHASSFFTAHVFARKNLPGRQGAWGLNQLYDLKRGRWVPTQFKDRWCIRYKPRYPGSANDDHDTGTRHHPDSKKIAEKLRRVVSAILNKKKTARWRVEGVRRRKERKEKLERYFQACRELEKHEKYKRYASIAYKRALAADKAYTPRRPS